MNRKQFVEAVETVKKNSDFINKLFELGIDTINCDYLSNVDYFFSKWMEECFGKDGAELVSWWIYEDVEHKLYKEGSCSKEYYKKGEKMDGEVIADLTELDDLYDYLLVNYKKG